MYDLDMEPSGLTDTGVLCCKCMKPEHIGTIEINGSDGSSAIFTDSRKVLKDWQKIHGRDGD